MSTPAASTSRDPGTDAESSGGVIGSRKEIREKRNRWPYRFATYQTTARDVAAVVLLTLELGIVSTTPSSAVGCSGTGCIGKDNKIQVKGLLWTRKCLRR